MNCDSRSEPKGTDDDNPGSVDATLSGSDISGMLRENNSCEFSQQQAQQCYTYVISQAYLDNLFSISCRAEMKGALGGGRDIAPMN